MEESDEVDALVIGNAFRGSSFENRGAAMQNGSVGARETRNDE